MNSQIIGQSFNFLSIFVLEDNFLRFIGGCQSTIHILWPFFFLELLFYRVCKKCNIYSLKPCVMVSIFEYTVSESHIVPNTSEYCLKSFVTDCTMYIPHFMLILQVHCCPLNFLNSGRALNTHRFLYISFYDVRSQLIFFNVNDQNIKALEKVVLSKYSN